MEPASPFVTSKFFGVTPEQAQRVQALLRLGVTDDDVRVAERLMRSRSGSQSEGSDNKVSSKFLQFFANYSGVCICTTVTLLYCCV